MKIIIENEKENPLLKRNELIVNINHSGEPTPSKAGLQQYIAKEKGKDVTSIEIVDINSDAGKNVAVAHVLIWDEKKVPDLSKVPEEKEKNTEQEADKTNKGKSAEDVESNKEDAQKSEENKPEEESKPEEKKDEN